MNNTRSKKTIAGKNAKFTRSKQKTRKPVRPQINWTKIAASTYANDANVDWNHKKHGFSEFCDLSAKDSFQILHRIDPKVTFVDVNGVLSNKIDEDTQKERDYYENARDWWEPTNPVGQCKAVIGDHSGDLTCYICGLTMDEDGTDKNGKRFTPECEHILPVFHANMFLSLYNPRVKPTSEIERELKMEYAWSHKCCNQIKSDTGFMHYNVGKNTLEMDYANTKDILTKIYQGNRADGEILSNKIKRRYPNINKWIKERTDIINAEKIMPICKYANQRLHVFPQLYQFSVLVNLISIADRNLMELAQEKAGVGHKGPPVKESKSKLAIYDRWSHSLADEVRKFTSKDVNSPLVLESFAKHVFCNRPSPSERLMENGLLSSMKLHTYIGHLCISNKIDESSDHLSHFTFSSVFKDMFATTVFVDPPLLDPRIAGEKICKHAQSIALLMCILNKNVFKGKLDGVFQGLSLNERQKQIVIPQLTRMAERFKNNVLIKSLHGEVAKLVQDAGDHSDTVLSILNQLLKKSNMNLSDFVSNIPTLDVSTYTKNETILNARQIYMERYGEPKNPNIDLLSEMELLEITAVDTLSRLMNHIQEPDLSPDAIEHIEEEIESTKLEVQKDIERKQKEDEEYEKLFLESALILENMKRKSPTPQRLSQIVESASKTKTKSPVIAVQQQMMDAANALIRLAKSDSPKKDTASIRTLDRIQSSLKRSLTRPSKQSMNVTKRMRVQ